MLLLDASVVVVWGIWRCVKGKTRRDETRRGTPFLLWRHAIGRGEGVAASETTRVVAASQAPAIRSRMVCFVASSNNNIGREEGMTVR